MLKLPIKVCGIAEEENMREVAALCPDFMGFIFYTPSPRNAFGLNPRAIEDLDPEIMKVAVFVNEKISSMVEILNTYQIQFVQLHGKESIEVCDQIRSLGFKVIKVLSGNELPAQSDIDVYENVVDYFLFDHRTKSLAGGSGESFRHEDLYSLDIGKPYFISGGLELSSIERLQQDPCLKPFALDINSRFESAPGIKDISKLKTLLS